MNRPAAPGAAARPARHPAAAAGGPGRNLADAPKGGQLTTEVVTEFVVGAGGDKRGHRTLLRLSWSTADPLAVRVGVVAEPAHPALPAGSWVVLRDFLRYGLEERTGDGDVQISPDGADGVRLVLLGGCRALVQVVLPKAGVASFLDSTERLVPAGDERSEEALDALIERLLQQ